MSAAEDFTRLTAHRNGPDRPPPGWEPGHLVNHETGVAEFTGLATTEAIDPDEATILAEMRTDPGEWAIKPGSLPGPQVATEGRVGRVVLVLPHHRCPSL